MLAHPSPLILITLACAALAVVLLAAYLVVRPRLDVYAKVWLLFGLGVFPIGVAMVGNVEGLHASKQREFCGSCHVMTPYTENAGDRAQSSLASRHSRNELFGRESCYVCHADYGMFGTVLTKLGGLGHVYNYYSEYRNVPLAEARTRIHLKKPYDNVNCMQCHSTETDLWSRRPDHVAAVQDLRTKRISCASSGCHGYAHPFSKDTPASSSSASATPPP